MPVLCTVYICGDCCQAIVLGGVFQEKFKFSADYNCRDTDADTDTDAVLCMHSHMEPHTVQCIFIGLYFTIKITCVTNLSVCLNLFIVIRTHSASHSRLGAAQRQP